MLQVGRFREPDAEYAGERSGHRPSERQVASAEAIREEDDVLLVGEQDHTTALERAEVARREGARGDAESARRDEGDVEDAVDLRDAGVFDAVGLELVGGHERRSSVDLEPLAVEASGDPQV